MVNKKKKMTRRDVVEGELNFREATIIQGKRSPRARHMDSLKTSKKIDKTSKNWGKHPELFDYPDVDTEGDGADEFYEFNMIQRKKKKEEMKKKKKQKKNIVFGVELNKTQYNIYNSITKYKKRGLDTYFEDIKTMPSPEKTKYLRTILENEVKKKKKKIKDLSYYKVGDTISVISSLGADYGKGKVIETNPVRLWVRFKGEDDPWNVYPEDKIKLVKRK